MQCRRLCPFPEGAYSAVPGWTGVFPGWREQMPWVFFGMMILYGLLSILFAFVRPPAGLDHFFKVPAIFAFLPDHLVMPVGRIFVGLLCIGVMVFLYIKLAPTM